MHLVDDDVSGALLPGVHVLLPSLGVSVAQVDDDAPLPVDGDGLGKRARRRLAVDHERIFLALLVAAGRCRPDGVGQLAHLERIVVQHDEALSIAGGKEFKHGLAGRVGHLVEAKHFVGVGVTSEEQGRCAGSNHHSSHIVRIKYQVSHGKGTKKHDKCKRKTAFSFTFPSKII